MALAGLLAMALAVMVLAPETPTARLLHRWLVEPAERLLSRVTRGHLLVLTGLFLAVALTAWLLGGDGISMLRLMAPEIAGVVSSIEFTTLVDVAFATVLTASGVRIGAAFRQARGMVGRSHRTRPAARVERKPANDDEEPRPLHLAA